MSGWGTSGWGTSGWGIGAASMALPPLSVVSAVARSTNTVRVVLSTSALASSTTGLGDALNPATWVVARLDTLFSYSVIEVDEITPAEYDVRVLEPFGSAMVVHEVSAPTLKRSDGVLIVPPTFADFLGVLADAVATPQALAASRQFVLTDVANPPAPQGSNTLAGTLVMTPGGDYASVSGTELLKKLILRRLSTLTGEFFHLPNYGIGLRVKEPLPTSDQIKLKAEIERQILLEPEVEAVSAPVSFQPANNILVVVVSAKLRKTGERIDTSFQFPLGVVTL